MKLWNGFELSLVVARKISLSSFLNVEGFCLKKQGFFDSDGRNIFARSLTSPQWQGLLWWCVINAKKL